MEHDAWTLTELCRSSWHSESPAELQTYLRGCSWSPDGTCCLTVVNGAGVHVIELPKDLYDNESVDDRKGVELLDSAVHVPECGLVYDTRWYPGMTSALPETCRWITARKNAPVQMWDAFDGELCCSYRGYDSVDELEAAISVCFSNDGAKIYAGYKKRIETFDTQRPGKDRSQTRLKRSAACLAASPVHDILAIGSWTTEIDLMHSDDETISRVGEIKGHKGGVTHLKFSPDGQYLISGARKDNSLMIWDIRSCEKPIKTLSRKVETNQRIYFDVSNCGKYLLSGNTDGSVQVWNFSEEIKLAKSNKAQTYYLHRDCCNGISIHPFRPVLATSSGQHHFSDNCDDDMELASLGIESIACDSVNKNGTYCESLNKKNIVPENSLEFWWISYS